MQAAELAEEVRKNLCSACRYCYAQSDHTTISVTEHTEDKVSYLIVTRTAK